MLTALSVCRSLRNATPLYKQTTSRRGVNTDLCGQVGNGHRVSGPALDTTACISLLWTEVDTLLMGYIEFCMACRR